MSARYIQVRQLQWANADRSAVDCLVTFETLGEVPFTAIQNDSEEHGREIFADIISGRYGAISSFVPPKPLKSKAPQTKGIKKLP